ncbi:hypothetical protein [Pseudomonas marincola]|uniref:hypothetical protein n=1 Tax=Pseudomonas marincola TaxID=437900 RepID=UPI0008F3C4B1|nr:hypothetical protein [Pseudomonas marincola]SFU19374.1 hypothetical protein SAMN05216264_12138 [Pseudomonas marincola]
MFAELASLAYWVLLFGFIVLTCYGIWKLVETMSFKTWGMVILVCLAALLLGMPVVGAWADHLHDSDSSSSIISIIAISLLSFIPVAFFFSALFSSGESFTKAEVEEIVADALEKDRAA